MDEVYELLNKQKIKYIKINHPQVYTYEDVKKYNIYIDALICKNLFIRNSNKSQYYILTLPIQKRVDLKLLQTKLEESRLSFGDELTLEEKTGVKRGSVSIFNSIKLKDKNIIFIIDEEIFQYKNVAFHPNINTETIIFSPKEIYKIFDDCNVKYKFIKID